MTTLIGAGRTPAPRVPNPAGRLIGLACRAPSVHNTQPWSFRVHGSDIDLFADYKRQLVYADPNRRDLMVSCGAALHHVQVAAAALGWSARVHRLPDASDERHVASIHLTRARVPSTDTGVLETIASPSARHRALDRIPHTSASRAAPCPTPCSRRSRRKTP